jgi:hypothetical protein
MHCAVFAGILYVRQKSLKKWPKGYFVVKIQHFLEYVV